jgi:hypothetical protein
MTNKFWLAIQYEQELEKKNALEYFINTKKERTRERTYFKGLARTL